MIVTENLVKYEGNKGKLFEKINCNKLAADAKVVVPISHMALIIDGGHIKECESGIYDIFDTQKGMLGKVKKVSTDVDIIFISKEYEFEVKWGTPDKIDHYDKNTNMRIQYGARGVMLVKIENPIKFIKGRLTDLTLCTVQALSESIRKKVMHEINYELSSFMDEKQLTFWQFTNNLKGLSERLTPIFKKMLLKDLGIDLQYMIVESIFLDDKQRKALEDFYNNRDYQIKQAAINEKLKKEREIQEAKKAEELRKMLIVEAQLEKDMRAEAERLEARKKAEAKEATATRRAEEERLEAKKRAEEDRNYAKRIEEEDRLYARKTEEEDRLYRRHRTDKFDDSDIIDRKDQRDWEREKYLRELDSKDKQSYYDTTKHLGWEKAKIAEAENKSNYTTPLTASPVQVETNQSALLGKFCSKCGNAVSANDKFCEICGNIVGQVKVYCSHCQKEVSKDAKFCAHCGKKVK